MTNHETNLRNHVLWHLKLFSGRKIVEREKRKLKKVLSVTKHGFVFWQHLSYERIQALKTGQEPGLLAPVDLASLSQVKVPINQKVSTFPKKSLETVQEVFLSTSVVRPATTWKQNAVVWKSHRKQCASEVVFALHAESNIRMRQRNVIVRVYVGKWLICQTMLTSCGNKPFHKKRTTLK